MNRLWILGFALLLVAGCDKGATAVSSDSPVAATNSDGSTGSTPPPATLDQLPAELKTDAYDYYGLGRTEPMKMQIKQGSMTPQEGTQTVKLVKVENGVAEFSIEHTDGLSQLGTLVVKLEKGGVKSATNASIESDESTWELPAGLNNGKTWDIKTKPSSPLQLTGSNKVEGTREVKTAVGTYKDALLISSTGTGKQGSDSFKLVTKMWLVKGRGTVKSELERSANGKTEKITLEEIK
jgi:hypothetical protein